jgi:hypothetical protein
MPVNVLDFGAVGNGIHDDGPAIIAADAAAAPSSATVFFPNFRSNGSSPAIYGTSVELRPSLGARWVGQGTIANQPTIRALGAIRSILAMTSGSTVGGLLLPVPTAIEGLTLDSNNGLATHCLLRNSDWQTRYTRVWCKGAPVYGIRAGSLRNPMSVGAITQTGAGPLPALSVPDGLYTGLPAAPITIVLKVAPGGTTFLASFDGGATYGVVAQLIAAGATSKIAVTNNTIFQQDVGIEVTWPAGPYTAATTYAFPVSITDVPSGSFGGNAEVRFTDCRTSNTGVIWATSGLTGAFSGILSASPSALTGTWSLAAGAQVIIGSGGNAMSPGALPGDPVYLPGIGNLIIACVLDDNHIAIPAADAAKNPNTVAGVGMAMGVGGGYVEDNFIADNIRNVLDACWLTGAPVLARMRGDASGATRTRDNRFDALYAFYATVRGVLTGASSFVSDADEYKIGLATSRSIYVGANSSVTFIEPRQSVTTDLVCPGGGTFILNGNVYPLNNSSSNMPLGVEQLSAESVTLAAATDQIPAPTYNVVGGSSSFSMVTPTSNLLMTSTPFILATTRFDPSIAPMKTLYNASATNSFTIQDNSVIASKLHLGTAQLIIGPGDIVKFVEIPGTGNWYLISRGIGDRAIAAHGFVSVTGTSIPASPGVAVVIASVSVTTTQANQRTQIFCTGAWNPSTLVGLNTQSAQLFIDGASVATRSLASALAGDIVDFALNWEATIVAAGAHTFDVRLNRSTAVVCSGDADITVNAYTT